MARCQTEARVGQKRIAATAIHVKRSKLRRAKLDSWEFTIPFVDCVFLEQLQEPG